VAARPVQCFLPPRVERALWTVGSAALGVALLAWPLKDRVVLQARRPQSVPFALGVKIRPPRAWTPGQLVSFRSPDLRPYYPPGTPFTKAVAAVPGDHVIRLGRDFYVNGRFVAAALETDASGRPAPVWTPPAVPRPLCAARFPETACRETVATIVPDGKLMALGSHARSFDSRYWGYLDGEAIRGRVVALF
jgi:type IV secretory pathway protease TraF